MDSLISPSAVPCSDMGSKTPTGLQQDAGFRGVLHGAIQRQETDMQLGPKAAPTILQTLLELFVLHQNKAPVCAPCCNWTAK